MKRIIIDALGSDKGPETIALGAALTLKEFPGIALTIVGPKEIIETILKNNNSDMSRVEIIDSNETITNYENPMTAIMKKTNSSLVLALKAAAESDDVLGIVTAGNTGAIIVGSIRYLSLPDMTRPCLSALLPNAKGGYSCLVDAGATIDATSANMVNFALLGSDMMRRLYKIENPTVGILSNGAEKGKGNKLVKETYPLLEEENSLNFIGNVEGSNALSGDFDVIVTDGFAGNVFLKNTEGMAKTLIKDIVKFSKQNNRPEMMEIASFLMSKYDLSSLGGAIILGIKKPIIKAHGNSNEMAIVNTSRMLINLDSGEEIL